MSIFKDNASFAAMQKKFQRLLRVHFPSIRENLLIVLSVTEIFARVSFPHTSAVAKGKESFVTIEICTAGKVFAEIEIKSDYTVFYYVSAGEDGRMLSIDVNHAPAMDGERQDLSSLLLEVTRTELTNGEEELQIKDMPNGEYEVKMMFVGKKGLIIQITLIGGTDREYI